MTETAVWDSPDTTTSFPQGLHSETLLMMDFHFPESTGFSNVQSGTPLTVQKKSPQYRMLFYDVFSLSYIALELFIPELFIDL